MLYREVALPEFLMFLINKVVAYVQCTLSFFSDMFSCALGFYLEKSCLLYDIFFLLKSSEGMNEFIFHLVSRERVCAYVKGKLDNPDSLEVKSNNIIMGNLPG